MRKTANRMNLTDGERSILIAYVFVALFGSGMSFVIINELGGGQSVLRAFSTYDIWSMIAGTVGAPVGLFMAHRWFGRPGVAGWARAAVGLPLVAFFAGIVGGTLALPLYGTMFGPFSVMLAFWNMPLIAIFFAMMIAAVHQLFAVYHRERETLFTMPPDDGIPV